MTRITGQQARELLDAATPGPWLALRDPHHHPEDCEWTVESNSPHFDSPPAVVDFDGVTQGAGDADLIAAAPALAETVAWLYGRDPDGHKNNRQDIPSWRIKGDRDFMDDDVDVWLPTYGGRIAVDRIEGNLTPGQAIELARALLAAAEKARHG